MANKVNILLLGWDQSPEREDAGSDLYRDERNNYRSDVLMLCTVDFNAKTAHLTSVPRDTYAAIYNTKGRYKINAAFAKGGSAEGEGFLYAMETVSALLGVPVMHYAGVNMEGLKALVDAIGGVYYDVDVEIRLNGRTLTPGYQHLNGQQVLDYCRARKGLSTDVGRTDRQQRILFAIFEQLKAQRQLASFPKIYASLQDQILTSLNTEQIAALTVFALNLDTTRLYRHTLAGEYVDDVYNGASFYVLDHRALKALVEEVFGIDIQPDPRFDLRYVKRKKAERSTAASISGARYLLDAHAGAGASALTQALNEAARVAPDDAAVSFSTLQPLFTLDEHTLRAAEANLLRAMAVYCAQNNLTRADVARNRLPAAVYDGLAG